MLNDLSVRPSDVNDTSFSASDYLLGIVQRTVASGEAVRIALPGEGEVSVFPGLNVYYADVADMAGFCKAPAGLFNVTPLATGELPGQSGQPLGNLMWQAAFHASQGRLVENCSKYDVVQFRRWPNLSRLPHSPNAMRIFALLTRHPTTIMLVHRRLGADKEEIYQTYSAAYCAGLVHMVSRNPQATAGAADADAAQEEPARQRNLLRSLFAKISGL